MWKNPQKTMDLFTLTKETSNEKLHFCAVRYRDSHKHNTLFSPYTVMYRPDYIQYSTESASANLKYS